jgi:ribosomal protein L7/L12
MEITYKVIDRGASADEWTRYELRTEDNVLIGTSSSLSALVSKMSEYTIPAKQHFTRKINAIKVLKMATGLNLKDAKELVERLEYDI